MSDVVERFDPHVPLSGCPLPSPSTPVSQPVLRAPLSVCVIGEVVSVKKGVPSINRPSTCPRDELNVLILRVVSLDTNTSFRQQGEEVSPLLETVETSVL